MHDMSVSFSSFVVLAFLVLTLCFCGGWPLHLIVLFALRCMILLIFPIEIAFSVCMIVPI